MIINLTPHQINIYNEEKELVTEVAPSGVVARVSVKRGRKGAIDGIPLFVTAYGAVENLPEQDGNTYIVSGLVRAAAGDRFDLYQPGELLRDADGRPIGCIGLSQ